ncbi:hypothetical protein [Actinomadura sp. KC216]|uniref:hypothetical protein n=1 Tax=Actinomadura sp. KC216 TaxID=2530370 RepID=UPI00140467E5|nr:hypothetical protein [Actinomadura sp. KC216]
MAASQSLLERTLNHHGLDEQFAQDHPGHAPRLASDQAEQQMPRVRGIDSTT